MILGIDFGGFWAPKRIPKSTSGAPKSKLFCKLSTAWVPMASKVIPTLILNHFGSKRAPFWLHFGRFGVVFGLHIPGYPRNLRETKLQERGRTVTGERKSHVHALEDKKYK